jgi:hypothetical protein
MPQSVHTPTPRRESLRGALWLSSTWASSQVFITEELGMSYNAVCSFAIATSVPLSTAAVAVVGQGTRVL